MRSASAGLTVPWRFGVQFRPTWPNDALMSIAADAPRRPTNIYTASALVLAWRRLP